MKDLASYIDHTNLKAEATEQDILKLCSEAVIYNFAAVCINPVFVPLASRTLKGTGIKVCTVVGFPLGANSTKVKVEEARLAVLEGADEIDMVINIGALKEGKYSVVGEDISEVVKTVSLINPEALVKVIIETCLLTDQEKIEACKLVETSGAQFVKTSTGFSKGGATINDVKLMNNSVSPNIGIKAAGGIRTVEKVLELIEAGASRIGTSSGVAIMEEYKVF